jgi:hypothetical protein
MSASAGRAHVLRLYRRLLRDMRHFPSIRRDALIEAMRAEFREKALLRDPARVAAAVQHAEQAVRQVAQYVRLDDESDAWSLKLEQDPLGYGHAPEHVRAKRGGDGSRVGSGSPDESPESAVPDDRRRE